MRAESGWTRAFGPAAFAICRISGLLQTPSFPTLLPPMYPVYTQTAVGK